MISAIVLAAGLASRMGRPKLLLKLGEKALVQHVVDTALQSPVAEVVVVLGAYEQEIRPLLADRPVKMVVNPQFANGQGSSVAVGVRATAQDTTGFFFLTGDQPMLTSEIMERLVQVFQEQHPLVLQPHYGVKPGNPCLFDGSLRRELEALQGKQGGRQILQKYAQQVLKVHFSPGPLGWDVDTPEDYQRMLALWENKKKSRP